MAQKKYSSEFIRAIPKTDLHVHLDGSMRISSLIDMAKADGVKLPSETESGLRELVFKDSYANLGEYLHGFSLTCAVLRSPENLERSAYELAIDNQAEGVRYIEVRYAPQLFINHKNIDMLTSIEAVNNGLLRAQREFNARPSVKSGEEPPFHYGIITCAMRMFGPKFSPYFKTIYDVHQYSSPTDIIKMGAMELAQAVVQIRDQKGIPIVGFDLAGQEAGYPASDFIEAYDYIHRNFIHKTVHAGEAYGAESIFQAITDLHADRIGHGYYLFDVEKVTDPKITDKKAYVEKLASYIAEKRVTLEVCLTSNMQTNPSIKHIQEHSFGKMLDRKISTTICTDNRLISNTTVSREVELAVENFPMDIKEFRDLITYGFKRSFFPGSYAEKRAYVRQVIDYYNKVSQKFGYGMN